jgi:hypothetical protein
MVGPVIASSLLCVFVSYASPGAADGSPIVRHRPERGMWELGGFGGVFVIDQPHDFYDPALGFRSFKVAAPDVGLRAAYYPLSFVGVEGEIANIWTSMRYGGEPAFLYGLRLHAILRLPFYRVAPFVLGGYGLGGVRSGRDAVGNDVDPIGHYGVGVQAFVNRWVALRLEGRHLLGPAAHQRRVVASHGEVLFGVSVTLGRRGQQRKERAVEAAPENEPEPSPDGDGDGIVDSADACPALAGGGVDGCPPSDGDGDGIVDAHDACPDEAGTDPQGCAPAPVSKLPPSD